MSNLYGVARISTGKQNIDRQIRNILAQYPTAKIIKETYTGTKLEGRKDFENLLKILQTGDKLVFDTALKGVTCKVCDEGYEPYSEYRPDEEISTIIAPLAVAARKTPSIFIAMFGNKLLIEAKRQLKDIYLNGKEPPVGYKNKKKT